MRFPIRTATLSVALKNHMDNGQTGNEHSAPDANLANDKSNGAKIQLLRQALKRPSWTRLALSVAMGIALGGISDATAQEAVIAAPPIATPAIKPGEQDAIVARYVTKLLPKKHISARSVDDKISERSLATFEKMLDPMKLYFLQSDIDELNRYQTTIDDAVVRGDLSPAYEIFSLFLKRVNERVQVALQMLDQDFEFNSDESIVIEPKVAEYAKTVQESDDKWRRQLKFNLLDLKDEGKSMEEAKDQLRRRYSRYAKRWAQTDSDELLELFLTSITMSYDPHTTYMSPGSLKDFEIMMRLNLEGIGAALREKDGNTVVMNVIPGGAADKDGRLKEDDYIVSVGQGDDGEMVDIVEMPLKAVVDQIRGNAGTVVRLGVKKGGAGEVEIYRIVRSQVELEESAARGKVIEHVLPGGTETLKIGYINLPSFYLDMDAARNQELDYRSSTRDVRRILDTFRAQKVDGVVLDLTKNGGGSLTEAISLTGLFIDRGPVVQVKDSNGAVTPYDDEESGVAWAGPLVVMTTKFSASASEILAGAIKDYHRGIIVGDPATHGKGTVQSLMNLGREVLRSDRTNLGALKVTLQQFYLPDGDSTQRNGVAADVILPSITADMDVSEADLDYALPHDKVKAERHRVYNMTPANLITQLREHSIERVGKDKDFMELMRRRDLYVKAKKETTLSLNEEKFMSRRKEMDAQQEAEKEELEIEKSADEAYRDYYYNREALNVAHEYINGLRAQNLATATATAAR